MNQMIYFADFLSMLRRFVFNTAAVWLITHWLYFPKSRRREYYFTFMLIGISVFFLINLLGGAKIKIELPSDSLLSSASSAIARSRCPSER